MNLFLFTILLIAGFFGFWRSSSASGSGIIINEIMVGGINDSKEEFIELYNTTGTPVNLSGFQLTKKTGSGNESNLVSSSKFSGIIYASGYFLISTPEFKDIFGADLTYSGTSYSIADNNTVLLYNQSGELLDKVGFGIVSDFETWMTLNPGKGRSIERKNFQDLGDNSNDFLVRDVPTPKGSISEDEPPSPEPEPEEYSHDIKINELLPNPSKDESSNEFVELYNYGEEDIKLDGWKITNRNDEEILSGVVEAKRYKAFKGIICLHNDGDEISLFDPNGELVDEVKYKDDDTEDYSWSFDGKEFKWTKYPTYEKENEFEIPKEYNEKVYLNEIFPNPEDEDDEFIEIYNNEETDVDLSDWILRDGSQAGKYVMPSGTLIGAGEYSAIYKEDYKFALNNSGEEIVYLYDPNGDEADKVSYADAETGKSYAFDGKDYQWSKYPTPGGENIFKKDYPGGVYLNEILPDPEENEEENEFVELHNGSDKDINLENWILKDDSKSGRYIFPKGTEIKSERYLVTYRRDFDFALNNSGDEKVYLLNPNDETVSSVSYFDSNEAVSYNFDGKNWRWSKDITPGKENKFNKLPKIEVDIDDDIYKDIYADFEVKVNDPEKEKVKVTWDFGDGHKSYKKETRHKYEKKGKYKLSVKIFDGSEEVIKEYKIEVKKFPHREVKIRTLCPNPAGDDSENEWILVKNYSDDEINLKGWSVATGSKKLYNHPIYEDIEIKKGKTAKITREDSHFTLNNEKSKVELRYPDGKEAYEVKYDKGDDSTAEEDEAYEKTDDGWRWTKTRTDADLTQTNAEEIQNGAEEIEEKNFEEFIGGQSAVDNRDNKINELVNYGVKIKLASYNVGNNPRVLGVSTEKQNNLTYYFTESRPADHYAVKFLKNILEAINYLLNKLISGF